MSFVGDLVKRLGKRLSDNQKKSGWGQTQATQSTGQVAKPNGSGTTTNKKTGKTTSNWGRKDTSYQGTGRANKTVEQKNTPVQTQKRIQNTQKGYTPTKEQTVGDIANSIKSDAKKAYDTVKKKVDQQPKSNWGRTDANYQGTASQNIVSQQDIKANVNKTRKEAGQAIKQNRFDQYKEAARKNIKEQKEKPASISDNFKKIENNAKETVITTTTGNKSYNYEGRKNTKEGLAKTKEEADKQYEEATKTLEENPALNAVAQGVRHLANVGRAFNQGLVGSVNGDVQTVAAGLQGLGKITGNRALEEYGRNAVIQGNQVMDEMQKQETEENPFSATWLGQQTVNAGNNFVGALSSALTGGVSQAAGLIPMGISVAGQSYGKALDQLTNDDGQMSRDDYIRALAYAVLNTVKEVGTEKYDPLSKMVPGRTPKSVSDVIGEGLEEVTGGMLEPYIEQILNTNNTNPLEVLQAGFKDKTGDLSQYALDQLNNFVGGVFLPAVQGGVAYGVNPTVGVDQNTGKEVKYRQVVNDDVRRSLQAAKDYRDYRQNKVLTKANQAASKISGNANQVKQSAFIQRYWNTESLTSNNNEVRMNAQVANRDVILQQAEDIGLDKKTAQNVAKAANKAGVVVDLVKSDKQFENQSQGFIDEDGTLHIRVGKDVDPVEQIVVHELTHATEGTDEYEKLKKAVFKMHDKGQLKGTLDYDSLSENEKVATLTTEALGNENSLKALASRNQGLGSWILDRVKSIATGTTPGMNKIERILNNAMLANPEQVQGRLAEEYTNNNAAKLKKGDTIKSNSGTEWTVDKVSTKKNSKGKVTDVTITASRYDKYTGQTVTEEMKPADIKNKVNTSLETASKEKKLKPAEQKAYKEFWGDYGIGVELQEEFDEVGSKDFTDREIWDAYRSVVDGKKENLTEAESIVKDYLDDSYGLSDGEFQDEYDPANFEESEQAKLDLTQDNAESGNQNTENEVEPVENQPVLPENSKLNEENTVEPAETNQALSNESNESNESSTEETENQGENSGKSLANTNEEESASEDYNIGDLVNNLRTIHNGAKANQEQAMQNAEAQAKADTETWQKNTEEAINEVGKGAITPEEFNKRADDLIKASKGDNAKAETDAATKVLEVLNDDNATDEQKAQASDTIAQALEEQLKDIPEEERKDIVQRATRVINQTIETKIKDVKTPISSKQEYQKMLETVPDAVSHLVENFKEYNKTAANLWETDRENTLKGLIGYVPKILDPKTASIEDMDANRAEVSQALSTVQYFQDQYEDLIEQNRQKFTNSKKNGKGEFWSSTYRLNTDAEGKWTLFDKDGNAVDESTIKADAKKAIHEMNEWVKIKDDLLEKKGAWLNMSGTLMGIASYGNGAIDEMSPAGKRRILEKEVKAINDDLKKKFPRNTKARIVLTDSDRALIDTFATSKDFEERQKALGELQESIGKRIPPTIWDKIDAVRNTMLLSAVITPTRNTVGNVGSRGMYDLMDGIGTLIEKILRATGKVRTNTLDLTNDTDLQLVKRTDKVAGKTLIQIFSDAKKSGNMKDYLKNLFPDNYKELYKDMKGFQKPNKYGTSFDPYDNRNQYNTFVEQAAMHLRENDYDFNEKGQIVKLDADGKIIQDADGKDITYGRQSKDIQKIMVQSWHEAATQKYDARQMVNTNAEGKGARAKDYKTFRKYTKALSEGKVLSGRFNDRGNVEGTNLLSGVTEYARRNVFHKANPLYWIAKAENYFMNDNQLVGDAGFTGSRLAKNLARYTNAQGYTIDGTTEDGYTPQLVDKNGNKLSAAKNASEMDRLMKMATTDALESTFHDVDDTTKTINSWKARHPGWSQGAAAFMPFVGTPAAIGRRIVEFSPVGLVKSLTYDRYQLQEGNIDTQTYIRRLSQGTTGTAMAFVGGLMASLGILVAKGDDKDDDKEKKFKDSNGRQDYALVLPNGTSITLEWMAPATTPLLFGAHFYETLAKMKNGDGVTSDDVINDTLGLMEPWVDASYMSGLMDIAENFTGKSNDSADESNGAAGFKAIFKNYVRQFLPNEGGKMLQAVTGYKYSTYDPTFLGSLWRSAASNMFFTNMIYKQATGKDLLERQFDLEGNDVKVDSKLFGKDMQGFGRFVNTHFIPWTKEENTYDEKITYGTKNHKISFDNPNYDPINKELVRLYDATKGTEADNEYLLPKNLSYISTPDDTKFTAAQRAKYNKEYLGDYRKQIEDFINSPMYQNYSDTERVEIINKIRKMYYSKIQKEYYDELGLDSSKVLYDSTKDVLKLSDMGVEPYRVFAYNEIQPLKDKSGDDISNTKQIAVREAAQGAGDFDTIVKAYLDGKITDLKSAGLNRNVAAWTDTRFEYELDKMEKGTYEPKSESADGDSAKQKFENLRAEGVRLEQEAQKYGIPAINVWKNQDTPVTYKPDGDTLSGSGYADARYNAMVNGTWDTIINAVNNGELSVDDAAKILGCGKEELKKSTKSFWSNYYKIQFQKQLIRDGQFNEDDFKQYGKYYKADFINGQPTFDAVEWEDKEKEKRKAEYYGYEYDENAGTSSPGSGRSSGRGSGRSSGKSSGGSSGGTSINKIFKKADRERLLGLVSGLGMSTDYVVNAHGATKDVDPGGFEISNSDDAKVRQVAQADGTWKKIQDAVANGTMTEKDACTILGVSRKVFEMSDDDFSALLRKIEKRKQGMTDAEINAEEKARKKSANFFGNYLKKSSRSTSASFNPSSDSAMSAWNSVMSTHKKNVKSTAKSVGLS